MSCCPHPGISTTTSITSNNTLYTGLDVHKESVTVAHTINSGPGELMGMTRTTPANILQSLKMSLVKVIAGKLSVEILPSDRGVVSGLDHFTDNLVVHCCRDSLKMGYACLLTPYTPTILSGSPVTESAIQKVPTISALLR